MGRRARAYRRGERQAVALATLASRPHLVPLPPLPCCGRPGYGVPVLGPYTHWYCPCGQWYDADTLAPVAPPIDAHARNPYLGVTPVD
jgi:hypothetical protein